MIRSIYQVDFISPAGAATRLLDIGDWITEFITFSFNQESDDYAAAMAIWGGASPRRGARRPLEWSKLVEHASHAAAATYCIRRPLLVPTYDTGKLRVTTDGAAEVWDILQAVILSVSIRPDRDGEFATLDTYRLTVGKAVPYSGLPHYPGIPHEWMQTQHQSQTLTHATL